MKTVLLLGVIVAYLTAIFTAGRSGDYKAD